MPTPSFASASPVLIFTFNTRPDADDKPGGRREAQKADLLLSTGPRHLPSVDGAGQGASGTRDRSQAGGGGGQDSLDFVFQVCRLLAWREAGVRARGKQGAEGVMGNPDGAVTLYPLLQFVFPPVLEPRKSQRDTHRLIYQKSR